MNLSFDGFGINGPDEYKSRLATLTPAGQALNVGPLLAAAPELLEACKEALRQLNADDCPSIPDGAMVRGRLYSAIVNAEGKK